MHLLWISGIDGFCHRYEVLHRAGQARLAGATSTVRAFTDPRLGHDVARADVVIAYRVPATPWVEALLAHARRRSVPVLGTIDDLIFVPERELLPPLDHLHAAERVTWLDGVRRYRAVLDRCDGFLAPTEPLLEVAHRLGWRAWLHRDALSEAELALGAEAARDATAQRTPGEVVLGYFSGTPTHDRDFASVAPALAAALDADANLRLLVVGPLVLDAVLAPFATRVRRFPRVPWPELPRLIAAVDVCLAPLEPARAFAAAKGEVKYLEAAAVAVPTIASSTAAFRHAIAHGANGLLATGIEAWRDAVLALARDPVLRRALGAAARRDVVERFSAARRARELAAILQEVAPPSRVRPSTHPLRGSEGSGRAAPQVARGPDPPPVPGGRARAALEPDLRPLVLREPGSLVSPPLAPGRLLVQPLGEVGGVVRIDLATVTFGQDERHRIELRVLDDAGRTVVRRRRDAATAADRAWWSFVWPRGRLREGARYALALAVHEARGSAALSFALAGDSAAAGWTACWTTDEPAQIDGTPLVAPLALRAFRPWDV